MNKHRGSDFNQFLIEQELTNTDQPMTPTPRTDEAADRFPQPGQPPGVQWPEIVPADFARQLERDLATEREQLAANHEATNLMGKWLEQERELADKLAGLLENCREDSCELLGQRGWWKDEPRCDYSKRYDETAEKIAMADEALTAWKEARRGTV